MSEYESNGFEARIRYLHALDEATVPISVVDTDGRFAVVNEPFLDLTGFDREMLLSASPEVLIHDRDVGDWNQYFHLIRDDATDDSNELLVRFVTNSGSELPIKAELTAIRNGDESFLGAVCRARDVRQHDQQEQQLNILNRALRHNIRNQMNLVIAHAGILQDHEEPDKQTAATKIEEIAKNIINLSNKARKAQRHLGIPDDVDCQMDLVDETQRVVEKFEITYPRTDVQMELPEEANALAPPSYEIALVELMENAVIHHPSSSGAVTVTVEPGVDGHTVHVKDRCEPIPADVLKTIEQGREEPLQHNDGLGLWIVSWMAGTVGGEVSFERREDDSGNDVQLTFEALD